MVHAQNALMDQSHQHMAGLSHAHGWGVAIYKDDLPREMEGLPTNAGGVSPRLATASQPVVFAAQEPKS